MPTGLITLPLRLGIRSASFALSVTERAAGLAWHTVESFVAGRGEQRSEPPRPFPRDTEPDGTDDGAAEDGGAPESAATEESIVRDPRAEFELADPRVPSREAPPEPEVRAEEPPPAPPEPSLAEGHVDTEDTFVESFAEPGAENGVGAQIRIEPPWAGYDGETADAIIGRLEQSTAEELATIELYEAANKQRTTVMTAVERQLKARVAASDN